MWASTVQQQRAKPFYNIPHIPNKINYAIEKYTWLARWYYIILHCDVSLIHCRKASFNISHIQKTQFHCITEKYTWVSNIGQITKCGEPKENIHMIYLSQKWPRANQAVPTQHLNTKKYLEFLAQTGRLMYIINYNYW